MSVKISFPILEAFLMMSFLDGFIECFDVIFCPHMTVCALKVCDAGSMAYVLQAL